MAAVTLLGTVTFNTINGTKTVTATPAVNDLIVIVTAHTVNTSAATPTDDNSSGTYTTINSCTRNAGASTMMVHIRDALIGSAASTIFTHAPGTTSGGGLAVFKVTGMTKTGALAALQSAVESDVASGTPTPVLGAAALTANALIGAVFNTANPAALTERTSPAWTELCDVGYSIPLAGLETMSIDSGETGTSIAWGGTSASTFASLVVELDTSGTGGAISGVVTAAFTTAGILKGAGALAGSTSPAFTTAGILRGTGALGGASSVAFTVTGALTGAGGGAISGAAAFTFGVTGTLGANVPISGSVAVAFSASGMLTGGVQPIVIRNFSNRVRRSHATARVRTYRVGGTRSYNSSRGR